MIMKRLCGIVRVWVQRALSSLCVGAWEDWLRALTYEVRWRDDREGRRVGATFSGAVSVLSVLCCGEVAVVVLAKHSRDTFT